MITSSLRFYSSVLLHRHRLRQITRLVDTTTTLESDVAAEGLDGNGGREAVVTSSHSLFLRSGQARYRPWSSGSARLE
jgi:hypothetical protein